MSEHQVYLTFKDYLESSEKATAKLTSSERNLSKKLEAKQVELAQCTSVIDSTKKANQEIERALDIFANRN